ncbi:MAG: SCP-2 sterol transfer family protein [Gammaproteobacteria bacterium]
MADLFTADWMASFMEKWNSQPGLADALEKIDFNSIIAYGIDGEDEPRGVLTVENGKAVAAEGFNGQELSWDMRASEDHWKKWMKKPPGMMGLGIAYTSRKLKFKVGDYTAMIKDPRMAGPFIKSFTAMGSV